MPSLIAWLDASADDQRRMRDIIRLFTDRDSRDELGLGQVRDAISDGLFPGTTVLLTRARYLLFVPWCFQVARDKSDPVAAAERNERALITALKRSGSDDLTGLLGARVGKALQTLPSTIYWTTLRRYGIVGDAYSWKSDVFSPAGGEIRGDDDVSRRSASAWSATIPKHPKDFPWQVSGAFELTNEEAGWLRDRVLDSVPGTLMAHLMNNRPTGRSATPWLDESALSASGPSAVLLRNAEGFSRTMHGAALLYNLLLAEEYEQLVPEERRRISAPVDEYRDRLGEWAEDSAGRIAGWDVRDLWAWVFGEARARVAPGSERFITEWADLVRRVDLGELADNSSARQLVRERERRQKGAQARLGNAKRLSSWSGAAGAGALAFRWGTVRDIVIDIHNGLERDA